ncbi:hypothetical protein EV128_125148 [Rhizobium azibense]|nr:hypothetical protein EV128_125148 [Rhizobium azibense]
MKALKHGGTIDDKDFFGIYGGGQKKALDQARFLNVGGDVCEFSIRDLHIVQEVIDQIIAENQEMRERLERLGRPQLVASTAETETWKGIPNTGGIEVSSFGRFRSKRGERKLTNNRGIAYISLTTPEKKNQSFQAAKIVAVLFGAPGDGDILHFYDHDRFSLKASNLVWIHDNDPLRHPSDLVPITKVFKSRIKKAA